MRVCESFFSSSVTLVFSGLIFVYLVYLSLVHSVSVGYFNLCGLCGTLLMVFVGLFSVRVCSASQLRRPLPRHVTMPLSHRAN